MSRYAFIALLLPILSGCVSYSNTYATAAGVATVPTAGAKANVTSANDAARLPRPLLRAVAPAMSPEAIDARVEGVVTVNFEVDESGTVFNEKILSSPAEVLSKLVLEAVRQWKFKP